MHEYLKKIEYLFEYSTFWMFILSKNIQKRLEYSRYLWIFMIFKWVRSPDVINWSALVVLCVTVRDFNSAQSTITPVSNTCSLGTLRWLRLECMFKLKSFQRPHASKTSHWHIHSKIFNRLPPEITEKLVHIYSNR